MISGGSEAWAAAAHRGVGRQRKDGKEGGRQPLERKGRAMRPETVVAAPAEVETIRVFFLDNRYMTFSISSGERIGELRARVSRRLRLPRRQAECFELFGARRGSIPGLECGRDVSAASAAASSWRLVYAARRLGEALVGVRRRKQCLRLLYAQAVFSVVSGRYSCGAETAAALAALQCRAWLTRSGERTAEAVAEALATEGTVRVHLDELIPRPLAGSRVAREWEVAVLDAVRHDGNSDATSDELRGRYLDIVERWPSYGVSLFPCAEIAVYRGSRSGSKVAYAHAMARFGGDAAVGVSRDSLGFYVAPARQGGLFAARFFGPAARRATFALEDLKRWGHRAGVEFYVELAANEAARDLLDLFHDANSRIAKSRTNGLGLRVACVTRDGARAANLLRDYALAKLDYACDDDRSTTDDDDPALNAALGHWRAKADAAASAVSRDVRLSRRGCAGRRSAARSQSHRSLAHRCSLARPSPARLVR